MCSKCNLNKYSGYEYCNSLLPFFLLNISKSLSFVALKKSFRRSISPSWNAKKKRQNYCIQRRKNGLVFFLKANLHAVCQYSWYACIFDCVIFFSFVVKIALVVLATETILIILNANFTICGVIRYSRFLSIHLDVWCYFKKKKNRENVHICTRCTR